MTLIPEFERERNEDLCELEAILVFRIYSRMARAIHRNHIKSYISLKKRILKRHIIFAPLSYNCGIKYLKKRKIGIK